MKNKLSLKNFVNERISLQNEPKTKNIKKEAYNNNSYITPIEANISFKDFNDKFNNNIELTQDLQNAFTFNVNPVLMYDGEERIPHMCFDVCNDYISIIDDIEHGNMALLDANNLDNMVNMFTIMYRNRVVDLLRAIDISINSLVKVSIDNLIELGILNKEYNSDITFNVIFYIHKLSRLISMSDDNYNRMYKDNTPDMRYLGDLEYMSQLYTGYKTPLTYITIGICSEIYNQLMMHNPVEGEFYINYLNSIINNCYIIIYNALTRLVYEAYLLVDYITKSQYNN